MNKKLLYKRIDEFYGLGLVDVTLLRFNRSLIALNSGAWQVLHLRLLGVSTLLLGSMMAFFAHTLIPYIFIGTSLTMLALSPLCYPELMRIHMIRIAAGREAFSTAEGRGISESICQSQIVSGRQEKWRTFAVFAVPGAVMFLGMGLMSLMR